jgi:RNA polymerase sigma-70 factor (ECF subfamily)
MDALRSATDAFVALRPRLIAIAYRMLGTRADAEDLLQDAWLRWHAADRAAIETPEAWLVTVVTRLAIDRLRAAQTERAAYVGFWLPEPLVQLDAHTPESAAEQTGELSVALMWVLERLGPEERAAYLLREAFDLDYATIAAILDKSQPACRQLVHRAVARVQQAQPRFAVSHEAHRRVLERFKQAARSGTRDALQALLAENAELVGDGGGKVPSFGKVLCGAFRIANLFFATTRRFGDGVVYRTATVNGEPGLLRYLDGQLESALAFTTDGERILAVYAVRNPDKLARIPDAAPAVTKSQAGTS